MTQRYNVVDALALIAMSNGSTGEVRNAITATTDIPEHLIELATHELAQGYRDVSALRGALTIAIGRDPTVQELAACFAGAEWMDDGKGEARVSIAIEDDSTGESASLEYTRRLA